MIFEEWRGGAFAGGASDHRQPRHEVIPAFVRTRVGKIHVCKGGEREREREKERERKKERERGRERERERERKKER